MRGPASTLAGALRDNLPSAGNWLAALEPARGLPRERPLMINDSWEKGLPVRRSGASARVGCPNARKALRHRDLSGEQRLLCCPRRPRPQVDEPAGKL